MTDFDVERNLIDEWKSFGFGQRLELPGGKIWDLVQGALVFDPVKLASLTALQQKLIYRRLVGRLIFPINHPVLAGLFGSWGVFLAGWWAGYFPTLPDTYRLAVYTREGQTVYRFTDVPGDTSFDIVPGFANKVISYKVGGQEILYCDQIQNSGGMEWMFPFMDRLYPAEAGAEGSAFYFNGELVDVRDDDLVKTGYIKRDPVTGMAYHGMLRRRPWTTAKIGFDRQGVFVQSRLDTADFPPVRKRFGRSQVTLTYRVKDGEMNIEEKILNLDTRDTIQATGHHPWFVRNGGAWQVRTTARSYCPLDARGLPTGERLPVKGTAFDLHGKFQPLNQDRHGVLTDLEHNPGGWAVTEMYNSKNGTLIEYAQDQALPYQVIFDKEEKFFAVEALSSNVNSLAHAQEPNYNPIILKPGQTYTMNVKIKVSRRVDSETLLPLPTEQVFASTPAGPQVQPPNLARILEKNAALAPGGVELNQPRFLAPNPWLPVWRLLGHVFLAIRQAGNNLLYAGTQNPGRVIWQRWQTLIQKLPGGEQEKRKPVRPIRPATFDSAA
jgi:galactose mutarotase-like enzyme